MWTIRRPTPACWRGAAHEAHRETRGEVAVYRAGRAVGGRYRRALLERQPVRPAYPGGARKRAGPQGRVGRPPGLPPPSWSVTGSAPRIQAVRDGAVGHRSPLAAILFGLFAGPG